MGDQLCRFYQQIEQVAGLAGKTKLAIETKIPITKAPSAPDSPENIALFEAAIKKITGSTSG